MARIGILGGSFSPVHEGHLWLARQAREELGLERVYFVPARQNPLKENTPVYRAADRIRLLKKALKPFPYFEISRCDLERKGPSYTVDTLKYFRKKRPKGDMLFFLSGSDVLDGLPRWKNTRQLFSLCRFAVMVRPGFPWKEPKFPVIRLVSGAPDVSSTRIRKKSERKAVKSKSVRK
jgi:nicotinate-nucleotide adenylyltransferase